MFCCFQSMKIFSGHERARLQHSKATWNTVNKINDFIYMHYAFTPCLWTFALSDGATGYTGHAFTPFSRSDEAPASCQVSVLVLATMTSKEGERRAYTGTSIFVYLSQVILSSQDWTVLLHIADFSSYCRDPVLWHLEAITVWLWYKFHFLSQDDTVPLIIILHNSSYQALYCCVIFILNFLFFIHFYNCVWCYESVPCCLSWAEVKYTNFRKTNVLHAKWLSLHCIS